LAKDNNRGLDFMRAYTLEALADEGIICLCTTKVHYFLDGSEICQCKQAKRRNA